MKVFHLFTLFVATFCFLGCAEEGSEGSLGIDCGHGSEHEGHCHCDPGYLLSGEVCVAPAEITIECSVDVGSEEHENHDDENHEACLCPSDGECPCAEGTVEQHGGQSYCVPEIHE